MSMIHIMNVTDKVIAKVRDDYVELYLQKERIGTVKFLEEGKVYDMIEGYEYEDNQILKLIDCAQEPIQYVEDCDLGWC
ncbi:DUF2553 family protein [Priestia koreensis]|uniref:DUF2553 family protein n=1 Tax=Priestia koreensis TaxID=284581 RepID=A0A0M0L6X4_9BACI|nr:DUF2553 family protein [Priestia koreensis]KOO46784.1 hypothetical protein AMD01_07605 [Priestia koreensis]MCM3002858.1 YusG family protein [Priestia koreensis]UNL84546.1 DUF2553 family protein [Priestia koreensis]